MPDIIIIGAGTAGLTAALYAARTGKQVLVLEQNSYGGQIVVSREVDNYPGAPGIAGYELAQRLYEQAISFGATVKTAVVTGLQAGNDAMAVQTEAETLACKSIILATGVQNRTLGLPGEEAFTGSGISYCAVCDGAFFKNKVTAVVGGGNSAIEDVQYLSRLCKQVFWVHRRETIEANKPLFEQLRQKENVHMLLQSRVVQLHGTEALSGITVEHLDTKEVQQLPLDGLFLAIGHVPHNAPFAPPVALNEQGYILAGENCATNVPGVFAAGDCRAKAVRQLTTAAADGTVAALAAVAYADR